MKKLINALFYFISIIILIFSLAMLFIESRMLFALDWMVCGNVFNGFIRNFFKVILCLMFILMILVELFNKLKNNIIIKKYVIFYNIGLLLATMILYIVSTNYIGLISLSLMFIFMFLKIMKRELNNKREIK